MNIYDTIMNPLEKNILGELRGTLISQARGEVLEIGIGTGVNLPYYDRDNVRKITGVDIRLMDKIKKTIDDKLSLVEGSAERLPFTEESFDTVVATLILCSVKDVSKALSEIKRVLKPSGRYIFIEHILPEERATAWGFSCINPIWSKATHGCNINRNSDISIQNGGFSTLNIRKKGKSIFCYGVAEK